VPLFIGEAAGARVIQTAAGVVDVTASGIQDVLMDVTTHPIFAAGGAGLALYRIVDVEIRHDAGYFIGITPIVDGVALAEQTFSQVPPPAGTFGVSKSKAFFTAKGTAIAARVRMTQATGTVELADIGVSFAVLRQSP